MLFEMKIKKISNKKQNTIIINGNEEIEVRILYLELIDSSKKMPTVKVQTQISRKYRTQ